MVMMITTLRYVQKDVYIFTENDLNPFFRMTPIHKLLINLPVWLSHPISKSSKYIYLGIRVFMLLS